MKILGTTRFCLKNTITSMTQTLNNADLSYAVIISAQKQRCSRTPVLKLHFLFQPALPKVIDDDEDMDYEDEEEFMDHGHSLLDELELQFTSQEEMNKIV